jgi:hypothetical protein
MMEDPLCQLPILQGWHWEKALMMITERNAFEIKMVGVERFELSASWSQTRRANRAALHPDGKFGWKRIITDYLPVRQKMRITETGHLQSFLVRVFPVFKTPVGFVSLFPPDIFVTGM